MKTSKPRTALRGAAYIVIIVLAVAAVSFSIAYHTWTSRGDVVQFSPSGNLGLGSTPLWAQTTHGTRLRYGTNYNLLFVRDVYTDKKMINALR